MIRFDVTYPDGVRLVDVVRAPEAQPESIDGWPPYAQSYTPYSLGTIHYHYGFGQWVFDPHAVLIPLDQLTAVHEYIKALDKPTEAEDKAYNAYTGDPLAR